MSGPAPLNPPEWTKPLTLSKAEEAGSFHTKSTPALQSRLNRDFRTGTRFAGSAKMDFQGIRLSVPQNPS